LPGEEGRFCTLEWREKSSEASGEPRIIELRVRFAFPSFMISAVS
jgi:hypothetical protein